MTVYAKLNKARAAFHAKQLKKSGKNSFAGYAYFELGDFLIPALQVFDEVGLCPVVSFNDLMAHLDLIDVETGERILFTSPMAEANLKGTHPIQNLGAVQTYQRRYLYMAALELVEHDAIDASKPIDDERISFDQQVELEELIEKTQTDESLVLQYYKITKLADLPVGQFNSVKKLLGKKLK